MDNLFHDLSSDVFVNVVFEFYLSCGMAGRISYFMFILKKMEILLYLPVSMVHTFFCNEELLCIDVNKLDRPLISYFPCVNLSGNKLLLSIGFVNRFTFMCWGGVNCL